MSERSPLPRPAMVFDEILGQRPAIMTLTRALESGRVHHAYRFEGPDGVGKEMAAFALAQSLVCTEPGPLGCGACSACRHAVHISADEPHVPQHPDVILVQRGLYPPATLGTSSKESAGIGVDQIRRVVLARAGFAPHQARSICFIIRDAHELTIQAANALLKTLEEPAPHVHFVLLTSQPGRLIDTIRSRTLAVRFAPLGEDIIRSILKAHGKPLEVAALAQGSASLALSLADEDDLEARREFIDGVLGALGAPDAGASLEFAGGKPPDRDTLRMRLGQLAQHLALTARRQIQSEPTQSLTAARRYERVLRAIDDVERNAQPALLLESMLIELRSL